MASNIGQDYLKRLLNNKSQVYTELKPKDRIIKIIENHILPSLTELGYKFLKSRMQLERTVGDFKQIIWFCTSSKNYKTEIVKFEVYLKVENKKYKQLSNDKFNIDNHNFIGSNVKELKLWNQEYCDGWYELHLDDNIKVAERITQNILKCTESYLDQNSNYETSLEFRFANFFKLPYFGAREIPDILILSSLTDNSIIKEKIIEAFKIWKLSKANEISLIGKPNIMKDIEAVIKLL